MISSQIYSLPAAIPYVLSSVNVAISADYQNPALKAAGTLLYAVNPEDGQVYVLLSKEQIWEGPSSGKWKGFGGRKEPDESLVQTAVRETCEESRNTVKILIDQILYDRLIVVEHTRCRFLQLMLPIEYDPTIVNLFQKSLMEDPHFMEKSEIRWVRLQDLLLAVKEADKVSAKKQCFPKEVEAIVYLDGEELHLAGDFTETMTILCREAPNALDQLMKIKISLFPILVSDQQPALRSRL